MYNIVFGMHWFISEIISRRVFYISALLYFTYGIINANIRYAYPNKNTVYADISIYTRRCVEYNA